MVLWILAGVVVGVWVPLGWHIARYRRIIARYGVQEPLWQSVLFKVTGWRYE